MAIKMTCPCGKRMAIDKQYIGRKIACPGCGKKFVLDRARLAALIKRSQKAADPQPAAASSESAARSTASQHRPDDAQPADLDQDILTLIHDDLPAGALKLREEPEPDAALPPGAAPSVVLVEEGVELAYAGAGRKGRGAGPRSETDAIQEARHSFWVDLTLAFVYPFQSLGNALTFIGLSLLCLLGFGLSLMPGGFLFYMASFTIYGWFCAYYMSVVTDTSAGSAALPGIRLEGGWWDDVLRPGLLFILAQVIVFGPALSLIFFADALWPGVIYFACALFLWPMMILLLSLSDVSALVRLDLIALTILRSLPAYLLITFLLVVVTATEYVLPMLILLTANGTLNLKLPAILEAPPLAFAVIRELFSFYLATVSMRLIGLYYLHFKHKFAFEFE